jgi:hypothetical protein
MGSGGHYIVDVLLKCAPADTNQKLFTPKPCPPGQGKLLSCLGHIANGC